MTADDEQYEYELEPFSALKPRAKRWVWTERQPLLKTTLWVGPEGVGKGVTEAWLIAKITTGTLPGHYFGQPKSVVVVTNEDDAEEDILPRLLVAGADVSRVLRFNVKAKRNGSLLPAIFPANLDALVNLCKKRGDVVMVIIDPLLNHMTIKADAQKDFVKTVQVLTAIQQPLEDAGVALLGVVHYNKSQATPGMLDRLLGSKALATFPRAVLGFGYDPEESGTRLILQAKNNGGPKSPQVKTLAFTVRVDVAAGVLDGDGFPVSAPVIEWQAERDGIDPAEFFNLTGDELSLRTECKQYLAALLWSVGGEMPRNEALDNVKARTKANVRTIRRAHDRLIDDGLCEPTQHGVHAPWKLTAAGMVQGQDWALEMGVLPVKPAKAMKASKRVTKALKAVQTDDTSASNGTGKPSKRVSKRPSTAHTNDDDLYLTAPEDWEAS